MKKIKNLLYLIITVIIIASDQILKNYITSNMKVGETQSIIPGILSFNYLQNDGAAWNIFSGQLWFFYIITIISVAVVVYYLFNNKYNNPLFKIGLSLVLGGIIGNFIDRLHLKYVVDMMQLDFVHFNIFNIADAAITIGIIFVFIYLLFIEDKNSKKG